MEVFGHAHPFVLAAGQRPVASPLARLQARLGVLVATQLHTKMELDDFERLVLQHLDGTRDRDALRTLLADHAAGQQPVVEQLDAVLKRFAEAALLVA